jgi:tripartite-type tricarboxylate transporter receptor subunit TctC
MSEKRLNRSTALGLIGGAASLIVASPAYADSFPSGPVRLIVPFPPGGGADAMARIIGPKVSQIAGQDFVIENHGGANGNIGAELVARANPDGYTVLLATANWTISESIYKSLPFNVISDFAPVAYLARTPNIIALNPSFPAKTLRDLEALAKASPGKINYSSDQGGPLRLGVELLASDTGINLMNVPYNGTAAAILGALRGDVAIVMAPAPAILPYVKSGKLKALAVSSTERLKSLPDVPTVAESGVPGFDVNQWYGIVAPAKTPKAAVDSLNAIFTKALRAPDLEGPLRDAILIPVGGSPQSFAEFVRNDVAKWAKVAKAANIPLS